MSPGDPHDGYNAGAERVDDAPPSEGWAGGTPQPESDPRRERRAQWVSGAWALVFATLIGVGVLGAVAYAPGRSGGEEAVAPPSSDSAVVSPRE